MDTVPVDVRSRIMSQIRSKNTSPELLFRQVLWKEGFRYRIHDKTVFGTPDVSNKSKKIAIFIDGCFWHGCPKCYRAPKSNTQYWTCKLANNKNRRKKFLLNYLVKIGIFLNFGNAIF